MEGRALRLLPCPPWWNVLVVGAALGISLAAQQPTPTFRSGTRLIVQDVTVKDKDGKPVEGLTANDFVVTEDGERQTVSFVAYQKIDPEADAPAVAGASSVAPVVPPVPTQISTPPPADTR